MRTKSLPLIVAALAQMMLLTGCEQESTAPKVGDEINMSISAMLSSDLNGNGTKSPEDPGDGTMVNRCVMQIFRAEGNTLTPYGERVTAEMSGSSVSFGDISLVYGHDYTIVFWADCTDDLTTLGDWHYDTSGLPEVVIADRSNIGINDDSYDAFACVCNVTADFSQEVLNAVLTRPFGQLNIYAADGGEVTSLPEYVSISFGTSFPIGKNLVTDEIVTDEIAIQTEGYAETSLTESTYGTQMCYAYIWAPEAEQIILPDLQISFFDGSQNETGTYMPEENIPVRANYRTNFSANMLN